MNVFDKALEVMRERGMTRYVQEDEFSGKVCLFGALSIAQYGKAHKVSCDEVLAKHLSTVAVALFPARGRDGDPPEYASVVNNHEDTTQEDVELILKHASYEWELLHPST